MERIFAELSGTEVYFGSDPFAMLAEKLAGFPAGSVTVVTGRHSADADGSWIACETALRCAHRKVFRFKEIESEPSVDTVEKMRSFLAETRPAAVIALGGGSVMDAAKAAFLLLQTGKPLGDCFGVNRWSGASLDRIVAIPTTSGTGS